MTTYPSSKQDCSMLISQPPRYPHYSAVLSHLPLFPKSAGEMIFNTSKRNYEFVNGSGIYNDASFVTYHNTHNKCHFMIGGSQLISAPLSSWTFSTKFVVCRDRQLHVPRLQSPIFEHDIPSNLICQTRIIID